MQVNSRDYRPGFLRVAASSNDRSEVHELIDDIWMTFQVRIGVIDFRSLLLLALHSTTVNKRLVIRDFNRMQGVIRV